MSDLYYWNGTAWQGSNGTVAPGEDPQPPDAPAGVTATATATAATISWDAVAGAESYTVYRSTTQGSGYTELQAGITDTSYENTSLTNNTAYYYVVTASNANGESAQSLEVGAKPLANGAATLTLNPATGNVADGNTIVVEVIVNSTGGNMDTVQARLVFDPAKLSHVETDYSQSDFNTNAPDADGTGYIEMVRGNTSPLTGAQTLGHVTFQAEDSSGIGTINFGMAQTHVILAGVGQASAGIGGSYTLTA